MLKAAVSEYLSNNISVSFKAKFEADGKDNAKHEAYIRIKIQMARAFIRRNGRNIRPHFCFWMIMMRVPFHRGQ